MGYLQRCRHGNISQHLTAQEGSSRTVMHCSPMALAAFLINWKQAEQSCSISLNFYAYVLDTRRVGSRKTHRLLGHSRLHILPDCDWISGDS